MNKKNQDEKAPGLALAELLGEIEPELVEESSQPFRAARRSNWLNWYKGLAAVLALALLLSCSSLAWAVNELKQGNQEFYLRALSPELLALDEDFSPTEQPDKLFAALAADDVYYQYIAINRLVELYNNPEQKARAVDALQPFLQSEEPKLADAAALALDILQENFQDSRLCRMADGSIFFTLFNDYSDYGSHNQIWRIKDGRLEQYTGFCEPLNYVRKLLPSPDGRLLAVELGSYKSNFVVILDFIDGYCSSELVGTSRALWAVQLARQGQDGRLADIRSDHETYCSVDNLRWLDNNTLAFNGQFAYDHTDFFDSVQVQYNYRTDEYLLSAQE